MAQSSTDKSNGNGTSAASASQKAAYDDLSRQIETLRSDLSRLTETIGSIGRSERDKLVASARARGEDIKAAGEARYAEARHTAEGYIREGERYVREQPGSALGIAAAIGFLVGYVMTSRR